MICFLAARADENLRASLKCIQIEKYGSSESVNSKRLPAGEPVSVGGDVSEGQTS